MRPARVHVDHPRRDAHVRVAGLPQQRIDRAADVRVAARRALQRHLTLDRRARRLTVRVEVRGDVIPFDDRDRPAGLHERPEPDERVDRPREVLQHEADEHVVERGRRERQRVDVGPLEAHVGDPRRGHVRPRVVQRGGRDVDRGESRAGTGARERDRLRPDAAAGFEHEAAVGIRGVAVEQFHERVGLVLQPDARTLVVTVDVRGAHTAAARIAHARAVSAMLPSRAVGSVERRCSLSAPRLTSSSDIA